jgi:hypothetical protein
LAATSSIDDSAVQRILTTARSGTVPQGWFVWPLRRDRVLRAAVGWLLIALFGLVLLVPALVATVPDNFRSSAGLAVFTIVLLGVLGAIALGGLWLCVGDFLRYLRADDYLLVMTPDDFLKVTPWRVIHVPMTSVAFVTLKGVRARAAPTQGAQPTATSGMNWGSVVGGGISYRRTGRSAPSLAFVDLRTNRQVVVATDDTFDELPVLEEILDLYAKGQPSVAPRSRSGR